MRKSIKYAIISLVLNIVGWFLTSVELETIYVVPQMLFAMSLIASGIIFAFKSSSALADELEDKD